MTTASEEKTRITEPGDSRLPEALRWAAINTTPPRRSLWPRYELAGTNGR
jgi:hypothetical protein